MASMSSHDKRFWKRAIGIGLVVGTVVAPGAVGTAALVVLGVGLGTVVVIRLVQ